MCQFLNLLISLTLIFALIGMLTGMVYASLVYHVPLNEIGQSINSSDGLEIARSMQLFGQFGLFIIPPVFFSLLVSEQPFRSLGFTKNISLIVMISGVLIMFSVLPIIHYLAELNAQITLPEALSGLENWMKEKEDQAAEMSQRFLEVTSFAGLLSNLFMIAIVPAIGEELLFRSVLQPQLGRAFKNYHIGIAVTAILFGLMHLQFYGLLPRIMLGIILGYFYFWSRSIWIPIIMHFVNNGAAVIVFYLNYNGSIHTEMDDFGATSNYFLLGLSMALTSFLLYVTFKKGSKPEEKY